jgi:hypothetical protein
MILLHFWRIRIEFWKLRVKAIAQYSVPMNWFGVVCGFRFPASFFTRRFHFPHLCSRFLLPVALPDRRIQSLLCPKIESGLFSCRFAWSLFFCNSSFRLFPKKLPFGLLFLRTTHKSSSLVDRSVDFHCWISPELLPDWSPVEFPIRLRCFPEGKSPLIIILANNSEIHRLFDLNSSDFP